MQFQEFLLVQSVFLQKPNYFEGKNIKIEKMNASLEVLESMFTSFGGCFHNSHPISAQYLVYSLRHGVLFTRRLFLKPRLGRLHRGGFNRCVKVRDYCDLNNPQF